MSNIVIIGGGPSGMAAAIKASENKNNKVTIIERQGRVGRKLLSTGNGRCNLTNTGAGLSNYHGDDVSFAAYALKVYSPYEILRFFGDLGLIVTEEYGGRVYPMSNHAGSVLDVLRLKLDTQGVEIITGAVVSSVTKSKDKFNVKWDGGSITADKVIVACGGCAGSKLGGVMDGYNILKGSGHSRTSLYPALTQIRTEADFPKAMKGIKIDGRLKILRNNRVLAENSGDILFTETGISGTAAFEVSRTVSTGGEGLFVSIDFFENMTKEELFAFIQNRKKSAPLLPANQLFTGSVHNRAGQMICKYVGISGGREASSVKKAEIAALCDAAKDFRIKITGVSGFESAQVTAGGIKTSEFDPKTMESKLVPGLFACGEVLDIDGDCGGYNLQWAWASGLIAGGAL